MRVLITGINGFAAGYLAEHLAAAGTHELWGLARQPEPGSALPALRYVAADLGLPEQLQAILADVRPERIFHLAGQSNVPRAFADPIGTFQSNVLGQINLFEGLLKLKQTPLIVIAGSVEMYGRIQPGDLPIDEDTPLRPVNPYAVSKATQDLLAYQYHVSHQLRTIRLRLFNHIGPRQTEQFVASAFAAQIARIEAGVQAPVMRVGNLDAARDFTDVRDIARAYVLAAEHGRAGAAYNVGAGRAVTIQHVLDVLLAQSTCPISVERDPARMRPADVPLMVCDRRRFSADTGWEPQIPLEQSLADILAYWRAQTALIASQDHAA